MSLFRDNIIDNNWGIYYPTFLMMRINTTESLTDMNSVTLGTEALYLHEFIHFLQDLTTTYGLMNIAAVVDIMKDISYNILSDSIKEVKVPFDINNFDETTKTNWTLKHNYLGSWKSINTVNDPLIYRCSTPFVFQNKTIEKRTVILKFKDEFGQDYQYYFGSHCISESMAFLIENFLYPEVIPKPSTLPYFSAKIVADIIYPGFSKKIENLIALCDASLMIFEPGVFFYDTLFEMVKKNFVPQKSDEIYEFVYNVEIDYENLSTIPHLLDRFKQLAINQLGDYVENGVFGETNQWINEIISNYVEFRLNNPNFILDFINSGQIKTNKYFYKFYSEYGSPIALNLNSESTISISDKFKNSSHPQYLWVIKQIYKILTIGLTENTFMCEMIEWCKQSCKDNGYADYTDEKCRYSPWERSSYKDLCCFGLVWKAWGFENKIPIE